MPPRPKPTATSSGADHQGGTGQRGIPLEDMPAYIQEVLDLIEWANGPVSSKWGAVRAAAGHPEPFNLQYLGVGNEDRITPVFKERFQLIHAAIKAKHPEITVIGTTGPFHSGEDYDNGWKIADELRVAMVDEHYYVPPQWFWDNLERYDRYDRAKSKVYVGEYAAHDDRRRTTLRSALAEAAYLTSLERNADVVRLASYAPLLAKRGNTQWNPNLIYFSNTEVVPTINYHVQQLFSVNGGDCYLAASVDDPARAKDFALSAVRDSKTGDVILKLVNGGDTAKPVRFNLNGLGARPVVSKLSVLANPDPMVANEFGKSRAVVPVISDFPVGQELSHALPAHSLTVLRIPKN